MLQPAYPGNPVSYTRKYEWTLNVANIEEMPDDSSILPAN